MNKVVHTFSQPQSLSSIIVSYSLHLAFEASPEDSLKSTALKMTYAMLRTAPPAGRFLYGDIALLSEDDEENGSEGSGSEERTTNSSAFRLSSSSSPTSFHIKVNRKRKMCVAGGGGGLGAMVGRLGTPGSSPHVEVRQRTAANARERDRTNSVNTAFTALRTLIPTEPADRYFD